MKKIPGWVHAHHLFAIIILASIIVVSGGSTALAVVLGGGTPGKNQAACNDFTTQMAWIKNHRSTLTITDALTIPGWIKQDAAETGGKLASDLDTLYLALESAFTNATPTTTAVDQVKWDCSHLNQIS